MDGGVVEIVASHHLGAVFVIAAASAEARFVVVNPWQSALKFVLLAYVVVLLHIGHAVVFVVVETCHFAGIEPIRTAHACEIVDHCHGGFAIGGYTEREHFAGKTPTAIVDGNDFVAVNQIVGNAEGVIRLVHDGNLLEAAVQPYALQHGIALGIGFATLRVGGGLPSEGELLISLGIDGKGLHGEGLHHIGAMVALGNEF